MILLRNLLPIVALLLALSPAVPACAGALTREPEKASVHAVGRGVPPASLDRFTRKHHQVLSLEESNAIDDDSDQSDNAPAYLVQNVTWYMLVDEPRPAVHRTAPPSHWPCAAPATGPPHA